MVRVGNADESFWESEAAQSSELRAGSLFITIKCEAVHCVLFRFRLG